METLSLSGESGIARVSGILRSGGVAAIPTETVYGLAANALDAAAVRKIFAAKGRPRDNPLIVHICALSQMDALCQSIPPCALALARAFWPGPLTMVLKAGPSVPREVTAGLDTVGIRMPAHPLALAVISAAGLPLAAPSANISGAPSPTSAQHVLKDFSGKIDAVLDGGDCAVGVESTVLDLTCDPPAILRPGAVTREMLEQIIGQTAVHSGENDAAPRSPGMKYRHYSPKAPLTLFLGSPEGTARKILEKSGDFSALCFDEYLPQMGERFGENVHSLGMSYDHRRHASRLFAALRRLDGRLPILAQCPRVRGTGAAVANRLTRAAAHIEPAGDRQIIGITGPSGGGKSALSAAFASLGAEVLDADEIYKHLLAENAQMLAQIFERFPHSNENGRLSRVKLRETVFLDSAALNDLNAITHPFVAREISARLAKSAAPAGVLDVPILFGSGIDRLCTLTVGVLAPFDIMLSRIMARDQISEKIARERLKSAQTEEFLRERCDILIENAGEFDGLSRFAARILTEK